MRVALYLVFIAILLGSCNKNEPGKIPGAFKAMQMLTASKSYPYADIPNDAVQRAYEHHEKYFAGNAESKNAIDPWESMGPKNTAGRCLALAINPQADSTVYLGSASGGLWRSRKLGLNASWEYVPTGNNVLGVSSIAFAPGDSMTMYIGTGEVYNIVQTGNDGAYRVTRGSYGVGILKSVDGGNSWTKSLDWSYQSQRGVQSLQVDPNDAKLIYASTTEGILKSDNAGDTWTNILEVPMATDIEVNGDILIAGVGNLGSSEKGLYRSTDAGATWTTINFNGFPSNFQGKIELASAPSNADIVYASIGNGFGFSDGATWLCKTEDAGLTWRIVNDLDYSRWQGWFAHDVAVHPQNPDTIMAIGIDIFKSETGGLILDQKSFGGVTLGRPDISEPDGPPNYSHSDHHVVLYHPNIEDLILFGNDGGLFLSSNGGENFMSANGGLQTTQFYNGFSVSHQDPNFAMGGLQDNSTSIFRGDGAWQRAVGGDGSWTGINFEDDQLIYASSQNLNMVKSINGGNSFFSNSPVIVRDDPIFIAPFVLAESDPNTIYAAGQYVYKSIDGGLNWSTTNNNLPINGDPIYSMAVAPTNPNVVYIATAPFLEQAAIFASLDGGVSFTEIDSNNLPDRFVNDITVDPFDEAKVYITSSGFGTGHLFVSSDYGQNWTDITADLPDAPGNAIAIDPGNVDHLYYGNDLGVYFSEDAGQSWEGFSEGLLESVITMDLKVSPVDKKIWVATHGNGAFRRDLVGQISATEDLTATNAQQISIKNIFPNPVRDILYVDLSAGLVNQELKISIRDLEGKLLQMKQTRPSGAQISIKLGNQISPGMKILTIENGKDILSKKFLVK